VVAKRISNSNYVLYDRLVNARVEIPATLFKKPQFDISRWYTKQRSRALGLGKNVPHQHAMGSAVALVTAKLLTDGISSDYPCTSPGRDPESQFHVHPSFNHKDVHSIIDTDLNICLHMPTSWLEDQSFDLVGWYRST
jgi:hypothetical protein